MADLHFLRPEWLAALLVLVVIALFTRRAKKQSSDWYRIIDPQLAEALIQHGKPATFISPLNLIWLSAAIGIVGLAGPSWHKQVPEGLNDQTAVMVIMGNSRSMYAGDILPNRNQAAKSKITALRQRLPASSFGIIAYASTAHLVIPLTKGDDFFDLFMPPLQPDIMPAVSRPESALRAALIEARAVTKGSNMPVNIVVMTDTLSSLDASAMQEFYRQFSAVEVLVVGTAEGGTLRFAPPSAGQEDTQVPVAAFASLKEAGIPVISMTADGRDLDWLVHRIKGKVVEAQNQDNRWRWADSGFWLVLLMLPLALVLLFSVRSPAVILPFILSCTLWTPPARADWQHLWWTPDQLGQQALDKDDYRQAATLFSDSYRKGRAYYLAKDYASAAAAFRQVNSPVNQFYLANSLAQQQQFQAALIYYQRALEGDPSMTQARDNAATVRELLEQMKNKKGEQQKVTKNTDMTQFKLGQPRAKSPDKKQSAPASMNQNELDNWMADVNTSPGEMMKTLFMLQAQEVTQ